MKKITGYLIDVWNEVAMPVTVEKTLDAYYRILNCDCIDIVQRKIGTKNRVYDIICDDEALLRENLKISAIDSGLNPMLCGNLFIVKFDGREDEASLDDDDIKYIEGYVRSIRTKNYLVPYPMLIQCDYD